MQKEEKTNKGWKALVSVAGAVVVGGLAYYLGYEVAKQQNEEAEERKQELAAAQSQPYSPAEPMTKCSICLRKMRPVRQLDCGHHFHDECVGQWLPGHSTCPLCRAQQH